MWQSFQSAVHALRMIPATLQIIIAVPILSTIAMAPVIAGDDSYSYEEEEACTGDAFRLCSKFIPDIPRITSCMESKRDQLSPKCAKMFAPDRDRHPTDPNQPSHDAGQQPKNPAQPLREQSQQAPRDQGQQPARVQSQRAPYDPDAPKPNRPLD